MAGYALLKEIKKEEVLVKQQVEKLLNVAMSNNALLAKVDKATTSCSVSKKPPTEILKIFETGLTSASKTLNKLHPAASFEAKLNYTQLKGKWRATATVNCRFKMMSVGGKNYVVKRGDTLWKIAKDHYGVGGLWTEIAEANKKNVSSKGDFILAGVTLKIPKLSVPVGKCGIEVLSPNLPAPKDAIKGAKSVCLPPYSLDFDASKPTVRIVKGPVVAWKVTTKMTGSLTAVCDLLMDTGLTLKAGAVSVEKDALGFVSGIEVNSVGESQIKLGARAGGMTWGLKLTPSRPGEFTGFASAKNVKFKVGRTVFSGKIGAEVTIQAMPRVRVQDLKGRLHEFWVDHGQLIKGMALVAGAVVIGVVAIPTIVTPVPGDEVVAYATALRLMAGGMKALRY